jgi:hypothetical protein
VDRLVPWPAVALAKAAQDDASLLAEGADIRRQSRSLCQRVEDNAFHLGDIPGFSSIARFNDRGPKQRSLLGKVF